MILACLWWWRTAKSRGCWSVQDGGRGATGMKAEGQCMAWSLRKDHTEKLGFGPNLGEYIEFTSLNYTWGPLESHLLP